MRQTGHLAQVKALWRAMSSYCCAVSYFFPLDALLAKSKPNRNDLQTTEPQGVPLSLMTCVAT